MRDQIPHAAEAAFRAWAKALNPEELPDDLLPHAPGCLGDAEGCIAVSPAFPVLSVAARCSGAWAIVPVALSWSRAIRGRTADLRRALGRSLARGEQLGLRYRVDTGYPVSIRELTEDRVVRLPSDPAVARSRAEVLLLLQRTAGAIGLFVTRPAVYSELAWTQAGLVALATLAEIGVTVQWSKIGWEAGRDSMVACGEPEKESGNGNPVEDRAST